jgi:hypothetical protein
MPVRSLARQENPDRRFLSPSVEVLGTVGSRDDSQCGDWMSRLPIFRHERRQLNDKLIKLPPRVLLQPLERLCPRGIRQTSHDGDDRRLYIPNIQSTRQLRDGPRHIFSYPPRLGPFPNAPFPSQANSQKDNPIFLTIATRQTPAFVFAVQNHFGLSPRRPTLILYRNPQ